MTSQRSDVRAAKRPFDEPQRKSKLDAMQVLRRVSWVTTRPIDEARVHDDAGGDRPLTTAEWGALMRRRMLGAKPFHAYWTLLHEKAGLLPDAYPMPRVRAMRMDATVREILEAVADMTIAHGPYAIEDSVYFEGISKVEALLFVVAVGS